MALHLVSRFVIKRRMVWHIKPHTKKCSLEAAREAVDGVWEKNEIPYGALVFGK